jgi:hypothetical protein
MTRIHDFADIKSRRKKKKKDKPHNFKDQKIYFILIKKSQCKVA